MGLEAEHEGEGWRVHLGDSLEVLAAMPERSVDAVVSDPPYGLEFMGNEWDSFRVDDQRSPRWAGERAGAQGSFSRVGMWGSKAIESELPAYGGKRPTTARCSGCGKRDAFRNPHECAEGAEWEAEFVVEGAAPPAMLAFQEWTTRWAREAYRVLRPGGWLVAFAGTRTYHRMASGIEDAGFEIRDQIHWLYGCLTPDVEVLTEGGWRRGIDMREGERIAAWDPADESIRLVEVQETFRGPWSGPMRVFRNADTEQVLTPNHRVWHRTRRRKMERGVRRSWWPAEWSALRADEVTRSQPTKLPLAGFADGPGIGGTDYAELLAFVWTEGSFDQSGTGVRVYQSASANPGTHRRIARLVGRLAPHAKKYDRERVYESRVRGAVLSAETCWFFTGDLARRVREDLPGKAPGYGLLWRMTLAEKVAFLDAAMAGDGSGAAFDQKERGALEWFQTLAHLVGWSAHVRMRRDRLAGACQLRRSSTTEMQSRHFRASYDAHYSGEVWCVRVPTGAFLARRGGHVFVTGNSGFPKSLNVGLAVEAEVGSVPYVEKRTVVVEPTLLSEGGELEVAETRSSGIGTAFDAEAGTWAQGGGAVEFEVRRPSSEEGKRWEGWGTALKPAHEPMVLARKPFAATVARNVLEHGTGALNISGCSVGTGGEDVSAGLSDPANRRGVVGQALQARSGKGRNNSAQLASLARTNEEGRWPANLVVQHSEGCRPLGTMRVRSDSPSVPMPAQGSPTGVVYGFKHGEGRSGAMSKGYSDGGTEDSLVFECVDGCPVRAIDNQARVVQGLLGGIGPSRFFYCPKPSAAEKELGLDPAEFPPERQADATHPPDGVGADNPRNRSSLPRANSHPTVKPVELMRWLVRLVTPPGGTVLDPFVGSGTTGCAAVAEGMVFVGVERDERWARMAARRIEAWRPSQLSLLA